MPDPVLLRSRAMNICRPLPILLALGVVACGEKAPPGAVHCPAVSAELAGRPPVQDDAASELSEDNLRAWVEALAAPEMKGRHATSDEVLRAATLLAERMDALGLEAPFARDSYCQAFPLSRVDGLNVVGHLSGQGAGDPTAVLIGAHYDGQGVHPAGFVFPGADDNASGVAALLEVARLAARRTWPFDLVFVAFGAEEVGQSGAEAWVREPTVPLSSLLLMINFDMVGRPWPAEPAEAIGYQTLGAEPDLLNRLLAEASAASEVDLRRLSDLFAEDDLKSDSTVFSSYVPTLYLSTGLHDDYHQRTDAPELVDTGQIARAARLTLSLLERFE